MNKKISLKIIKYFTFIISILSCFEVLAQSEGGQQGLSTLVLVGIVALVIAIVFAVIILVSDNLIRIRAKQIGADKYGENFSIFPVLGEIAQPKVPKYVNGSPVTYLKRGHDILLDGFVESKEIKNAEVSTFAVQPPNFIGIAPIPKLEVEIGATVKAGDPVFYDKSKPEMKFVAPVSGEVATLNRGAKRSIKEVVILADKEQQYRELPAFDLENGSREELVAFILDSGAWPLIRQRPYNIIANSEIIPRDIFVSTFDTAPLAPDNNLIVDGNEEAFQKGIDILSKLTSGKVHLGLNANEESAPHSAFLNAENAHKHWFKGKHPSGNVGVQIHHIAPISNADDIVWTLGVQDVITLGALITEKRFNAKRIIALTGSEVIEPKLVKTYLGANVSELVKDQLKSDHVRLISGDVLSGSSKELNEFMDVYDDQLTVIEEGDYYEMFGWLLPLKGRPSISRTFPNFLFPGVRFKGDTNTHGEKRAFVVTGQYESVLPMDVYPQHVLKSILVNDFESMEGLGIYELVEEDLALCEFVCTSKQPVQKILREGLDLMREQG